jgi:hypothetical protein
VKKEQNGRESFKMLKPTVGCNASKRRRSYLFSLGFLCLYLSSGWSMLIRILNWGSCASEIVDCDLVVRDAMYRFIVHRSFVKLELKFLI